jgi:uncharacterized membrane protein YhaH (DUF805 family)
MTTPAPSAPTPYIPAEPQTAGVPPLWAPYYSAPFSAAFTRFWKKYATFSGRASRSEYWKWVLAELLISIVLGGITVALAFSGSTIDSSTGAMTPGPLFGIGAGLFIIWYLVTIVPHISLGVRRLHDINQSGWMYLLNLIPSIGSLIILVLSVLPADPRGARFDQPNS